jgi:formate C-acetyltransferase
MVQAREKSKITESKLSARVQREKETLLSATPHVDVEKIKFQLEVYEANKEKPAIIKGAKLFYQLCNEKTIFIDDNPLVGTLTKYKYGSYPIPEFGSRWLKKVDRFSLQRGSALVAEEEKEWINKAADYWQDASVFQRTKEMMLESRGVDIGVMQKCGLGTEYTPGGFGGVTPDFAQVLNKGLTGVIAEIQEEKSKLETSDPESVDKWNFYTAAALYLNGMSNLAHRYASLAEEMAREEREPGRKQELKTIVEVCRRVPALPARNFREALQCVWFITLGVWIEAPFVLNCPPGRFTQYMYPFYKKDRDEGKLTDEETIELLQFFFIKLNGLAQVLPPHGFAWSQSRLGLHLCLGGLTADGEDATNDLDWLVLEAQRQVQLPEPLVDLLYHDKLSQDFLLKCVDLIKTGIGQPAVHNVTKGIERHLYHQHMPLEEARNFSILGCVQSWIAGYSLATWEGAFNMAKMVELALNDGKDPLSGIQLGPETGESESFQSYDELYAAVVKQLKYFIPLQREIGCTAWKIERGFPIPFVSALTNDCIKRGRDVMDGGARYNQANGMTFVGGIDAANSLAAIKKLVFEDKKITMKRLKEALAADFEGYEDVWQMCREAPKYGNDDDYVDSIAKQLYQVCYEEHQKFPDFLGRPSKPEAYSVTTHFATGRFTGALPYGRKARTPLTDASVSASPGTDTNGPTALVKSAAKVLDTVKWGGNHLNMKFHPSALRTVEGARKLLSLIKTYFDLGGYHVQFNCVSSETLRQAQLHPGQYRNLIVRVAGFSAFFIHLDREVQDEIIKRTELVF